MVVAQKIEEVLKLNKSAYMGISILDFNKSLMFDFYYNHIKDVYGKKIKLIFTDTDDLVYEIEANDVYNVFTKTKARFILMGIHKNQNYTMQQTKN